MKFQFLRSFALPIIILLFFVYNVWAKTEFNVIDLRCDYGENPLGVDSVNPRLFWKIESSTNGEQQTAYQILIASTEKILAANTGDLWNSGRISSDQTTQISYRGKPLHSAQKVFWKVRVWNKDGKAFWSLPAAWTMGLLNESDWKAKWIEARNPSETLLVRRQIIVKPGLKRAVAFVSGLGFYEFSINGKKISDELLAPGWTKYDKTILYETLDLTAKLHSGENAVGIILGNGMYNVKAEGRYTKFENSFGNLKAIVQIQLEYSDGTSEIFGTDENWKTSPSPVTFSTMYGGEDYDARLEQKGWNEPNFDDKHWTNAAIVPTSAHLKGFSNSAPPIKSFDILKPVKVNKINETNAVYDLGQNASIIPRISVKGERGSIVRITPAELIKSDGTIDRSSVGGKTAYWQYTLKGDGLEIWFPKFFYHGARYLQVEVFPASNSSNFPQIVEITDVVVYSDSKPVGTFTSSNQLFNQIHNIVRWAQRSNMMSVLTDCPHRERLGWLEQNHLNGYALRYEFDLSQLLAKSVADMSDSQLENGLVPDIAPEFPVFEKGFRDSPEWGSAVILVPWQQFEFSGDKEILQKNYEAMTRYFSYLESKSTENIVSHGLGDWYDIGPKRLGSSQLTPIALTATAFYFEDAKLLSEIAKVLGKNEDAKHFAEISKNIRNAFNAKFYDAANGYYATNSQAANSIPLVMNLVEEKNRQTVFDNLVNSLKQSDYKLTAGDVGYRYLLLALAQGGRSDIIFTMNNQSESFGYGYQIKQGATALTESWTAERRSSQNHFMLGQINEWFYRYLAGIEQEHQGFEKIVIKPQIVDGIDFVNASFDSIHGKISIKWAKNNGKFTMSVSVPANTTATVYVPANSPQSVIVGQKTNVKFLRFENNSAVYAVDSGSYNFDSIIKTP